MGAEERIGDLLEQRLGTYVKRAEQELMAAKDRALRPFGLTVAQYQALFALAQAPLSGAQLARIWSVTPQTMATVLTALEGKGLVVREPSDVHAQVLVGRLTRPGQALFKKADQAAGAVEARLSAAYTDDEEKALRELLQRSAGTLAAT